MDALEFCALSEESVAKLLKNRLAKDSPANPSCRRKMPRWPFPGTVELWVPDEDGVEQHTLATSLNLSLHGVGIKVEDELPVGLSLSVAIHEPEISFHGRVIVRHCTRIDEGYYVGMQFQFDEA